jgi:hypothetical protein
MKNIAFCAIIIKEKGKKMKSVHHAFLPAESRQNLVSIGSPSNPDKSFTKADFLPPNKVAKKFDIPLEMARILMKTLLTQQSIFILNGHKARVVSTLGKQHGLFLHPLATEIFQEFLTKQRN